MLKVMLNSHKKQTPLFTQTWFTCKCTCMITFLLEFSDTRSLYLVSSKISYSLFLHYTLHCWYYNEPTTQLQILYVEEQDSVTVQACWLLHDNTTPLTWKISSWSQVTSQPTDLISYFPIEAPPISTISIPPPQGFFRNNTRLHCFVERLTKATDS